MKRLSVQALESRKLLAGDIGIVDTTLHIEGTTGNDIAEVYTVDNSVVVKLQTQNADGQVDSEMEQTFDADLIDGIIFEAFAGDDLLVNDTSLDSIMRAGGGNDIVMGGEGNDILVAGAGADVVLGGGGDDVILGGPGDNLVVQSTPGESVSDAPDSGETSEDPVADAGESADDPGDMVVGDETAIDGGSDTDDSDADNAADESSSPELDGQAPIADETGEAADDVDDTPVDNLLTEDVVDPVEEVVDDSLPPSEEPNVCADPPAGAVSEDVVEETVAEETVGESVDEAALDTADEAIGILGTVETDASSETEPDTITEADATTDTEIENSVDSDLQADAEIDPELGTDNDLGNEEGGTEPVSETESDPVAESTDPDDAESADVPVDVEGVADDSPEDTTNEGDLPLNESGEDAGQAAETDPVMLEPVDAAPSEGDSGDAEPVNLEPVDSEPVELETVVDGSGAGESVEETVGDDAPVANLDPVAADETTVENDGSGDEPLNTETNSDVAAQAEVAVAEDESDDDVLFGGSGNDWIFGESGNDTVFGGDSPLAEDVLAQLLSDRLA